jgi:hypothetical protein
VVVFSGRRVATAGAVCLALLAAGCGDDEEPEGGSPPEAPSSSSSSSTTTAPTDPTGSTTAPAVEPATGPPLKVKGVSLRLPEGWHVDNTDASFLHVGAADDRSGVINLGSFPALDPDVSLNRLARSTIRTGGYEPGEILPETTVAGRPAFHVAGPVAGDPSEEFGLVHDGEIVSVEFVFFRGPAAGRQELIESVLATVELG